MAGDIRAPLFTHMYSVCLLLSKAILVSAGQGLASPNQDQFLDDAGKRPRPRPPPGTRVHRRLVEVPVRCGCARVGMNERLDV